MISLAIEGATRRIGKAQGYHGLCVRDCLFPLAGHAEGVPAMQTAWQPTPDELARLVAGAPLYLTLLGSAHPPVLMQVGDVPA
ncbi:MAG: hypothetical protein V4720_06440 [Pseudomonadota bacterium]